MIVGTEYQGGPGLLEQYPVSPSEVFGLGVAEAWADNPSTKLFQWLEKKQAPGPIVPKPDVEARAKEQGVSVHNIPDEGLSQGAADLLIERQYQKKLRRAALDAADSGFAKSATEFAGQLVGSALDPIGVAASFIPVVGQARYGAMLAKASGPLGRTAVRAGVGAAEGAVGAALLEPANYLLSQELGDDYTALNSLVNIGFGTVMGAGLHMGAGAVSDAIKMKFSPDMATPQGKVAGQMDALTPEARAEAAQAAIAQAANDQMIDVAPVVKAHVEKEIPISRERRLQAAREVDPEAFQMLDNMARETEELDLEISRLTQEMESPEPEIVQASRRLEELEQRLTKQEDPIEVLQQLGDEETGILNRFTKEEMAEARADFESGRASISPAIEELSKRREYLSSIEGNYHKRVSDAYRQASRSLRPEMREAPTLHEAMADETPTAVAKREATLIPELRKTMEAPLNSRFLDDELVARHEAEIKEIVPEMRVEESTELANLAVQELKETADQAGIDVSDTLKAANEQVSFAAKFTRAMEAMANCALRKG